MRARPIGMCAALVAASLSLSSGVTGCSPANAPRPETAALRAESDRLTAAILTEAPDIATTLAVSDEVAGGAFNARLPEETVEAQNRRVSFARQSLARFQGIGASALNRTDKLTRAVAVETLGLWIAGGDFSYGTYGNTAPQPYVVTHLSGAHAVTPAFLDSLHRLESAADAEAYIARLSAYAAALRAETSRITADSAMGVTPPNFIIDQAIARLQSRAQTAAEDSLLVQSLERRADGVPGQAAFVSRAAAIVSNEIIPAYRQQMSALAILRSKATEEAGVSRLPRGRDYYTAALRAWTTSDLDPDAVHRLGLALVRSYDAELDKALRAQGRTKGSVGARLSALAHERSQRYPNTDAGRDELLRDVNDRLAVVNAYTPLYFAARPKAKLDVRRAPIQSEAVAPGAYYQAPSLAGRAGAFYFNLRDMAETPRFAVATLTFHEGVPGHHWQMAIAQESKDVPLLRGVLLRSAGFTEGWALYAEQLADEMGVYKNDPLGRIGYLQSMLFRAARLVVDTGIHTKGWSRERAIDYLVSVTGMERSAITTEVDRYVVWPGQACTYMVGLDAINSSRHKARATLGPDFDIRAFHDALLKNGPIPLTLLDDEIDAWVAEQKQPAKAATP